jgi:hypothetical protein
LVVGRLIAIRGEFMSSLDRNREGISNVEAELLRRGAASVTFHGTQKILLHATNSNHSRTVELRVKVKTKRKGNWHTRIEEAKPTDTPLDSKDGSFFWVFVDLEGAPRYWIVPDEWLRKNVCEEHQLYLKKHGGHRPKNDASNHHAIAESRLENWQDTWDILGIFMPTWLEDISAAYANLGGVASYSDLYREIQRIRPGPLPESWQAIIRAVVEDNSSDSARFKGNDRFFSAQGLGGGVWGLRTSVPTTPQPSDIEPPNTERVAATTYRVLRDTLLARTIKVLHRHHCQLCGETIALPSGLCYSEAHHIRPLGTPHNGFDIAANILVLCPKHHVMCDYGCLQLDIKNLRLHPEHVIGQAFIDYHNSKIVSGGQIA